MDTDRTPLETHLWDLGILTPDRQAAIDRLRRGPTEDLPASTLVTFDPGSLALRVTDLGDPDNGRQISLPRPKGQPTQVYRPGGPHLALFGGDHRKLGEFALDGPLGLVRIDGGIYRYAASFRHAAHLAPAPIALAPATETAGQGYGPFDLSLHPTSDDAVIVDRGTGLIQHVELGNGQLGYSFKLRSRRSTTAINLAWHRNRLLATDGRNLGLTICDLYSGEIWPSSVDHGVVGNLLTSPDGSLLYLVCLHPEFAVYEVDPDTFEQLRSFPLKGKPYSAAGDPTDLMAISPDGKHLMVLSHVDVPVRNTPVLNVIELTSGEVGHRYRLSPDRKPVGLAYGVRNPLFVAPVSFEDAIVELGFLSAAELDEVRQRLESSSAVILSAEDLAARPTLEALAGGYTWRRANKAEPAPHLTIPPKVAELIADYLAQHFAEQTGRYAKTDAQAWARVQKAAEHVRTEMESFSGVEVALQNLMDDRHLNAFISREMIQEWLIALEHDDLLKGLNVQTVPDRCPNCRTPLFGVFTCPACGTDVAVDAHGLTEPRSLSPATMHPHAFLPADHLLVPDPLRRRLIELDKDRQVFWELGADARRQDLADLLRWPWDALRLPNKHTLVADSLSGRVFEVTRFGRPYWEWQPESGLLQEPVRLARSEWGHIFVADRRANRIWRIDAQGNPMPCYGDESGQLNQPTDIQVLPNGNLLITDSGNDRVIEVQEGRIVQQIGGDGEVRLHDPRRAVRFDNGLTMILDSGHHRLVGVDPSGAVVWQHDTILDQTLPPVARPQGFVTLPEGRLAYWDQHWLVEIDHQGTLLWSASFDTLDEHPRLQKEPAEATRDRRRPRRLWQVGRLADSDPAVLALQAAQEARQKKARALRNAWRATRQAAVVALLRLLSKQRLTEVAERTKAWLARRGTKPSIPKATPVEPPPAKPAAPVPNPAPIEAPSSELAAATPKPVPPAAKAGNVEVPDTALEQLSDEIKKIETRPPPLEERIVVPDWTEAAKPQPIRRTAGRADLQDSILTVPRNNDSVVWISAGQGVRWVWGRGVLKRPRTALLLPNGHVLIADTMNHRIVEVDPATDRIVWQVGRQADLQYPRHAQRLANGHTLIADTGNRRVVEVGAAGEVVWTWSGFGTLKAPSACERLANGHTLITDWNDHTVLEVDGRGDICWWYGEPGTGGTNPGLLFFPEEAQRLANERTLIVDSQNHRLIEVSRSGHIRWEHRGDGDQRLSRPTHARRLDNGMTLIVHRYGRSIVAVDENGYTAWRTTVPLRL